MAAKNLAPNIGKCITLANGVKMPIFGLGTWQSKPGEVATAVDSAVRAGYRLIDGAWAYKNEQEIGNALQTLFKEGVVKREDIFITTKVHSYFHKKEHVKDCVMESLKNFQVDYVDLLLVHGPVPMQRIDGWRDMLFPIKDGKLMTEEIDHLETWEGMEEVYKAGLAKSIGISNFNSKMIQNICDHAKVKPQNLQVECHAYFNQVPLQEFCRSKNISFTAYAPIGSPGRGGASQGIDWDKDGERPPLMEHPIVKSLAKKHNKTSAQICLRYLMQREIVVIPKSTNPQRIKDNFDVWNFSLSDEDFAELNKLPQKRLFDVEMVKDHKYYPFGEV